MDTQEQPFVFGEWLQRRRKALDLTQAELAERAGCSIGALRKIESGDRRPSKQLAALLAKTLELSEEDQKIFLRVARGELNLERLSPPLIAQAPASGLAQLQAAHRSQAQPPASRIPLQTTPLIGRQAELAALERMFKDPQCRLLTLTGMGGIGKTRLAIEFANQNLAAFTGGVFYVPLTSVNSPEKVISTIAEVLNCGFSGPNDPKEQLFKYIDVNLEPEALLILDNLEHLLGLPGEETASPGVPELVCEILERLPNVKILGTSRERLNLHGEWTYELHGLSIPPSLFGGRVEEYQSIELFIRSAQRVRTDFQVTPQNQPALIQICRLLDGIPLAIELAAAWMHVLSVQEIAQEIQTNLDFLTTTMHDLPQRHRSMRATFDHSWRLLANEERQALSRLSVFQGGFDRGAANHIAGASLPILASLCDKSLVHHKEGGRYDLHEVIRQYARSHLVNQPCYQKTCERHCEYYLHRLADCERSLKNADQQATIQQLTGEIDNIRSAWTWAIENKKYDLLGQSARAYGWYFEITGLYQEGIEQFEALGRLLKAEQYSCACDRLIGLALVHQALLYFRKGEFESARKLYEESIAVLRPTGDLVLLADALIFSGTLLHLKGDYERARINLTEGYTLAQKTGDRWFEAYAIDNLGYLDSLVGNYPEGCAKMMAGIDIFRWLGDPHSIALGLNFIVPTLIKLGEFEKAKTFMQESIAICEQSKNRWGMGTAYSYLGLACIAEGDYARAKAHLLTSLEIFREYITGWNIAVSLAYLGHATWLARECDEAAKYYRDALHLAIEVDAVPIALGALAGIATLHAHLNRSHLALTLGYFIQDHPSTEGETRDHARLLCSDLEARLTREQIQAARARAADITIEDISNIALEAP